MSALADLLALADSDDALSTVPLFPVQAPDGRRDWAERPRQARYFNLMRMCAPSVETHAISNAGKRHPNLARIDGIKAGVFDVRASWATAQTAVIEFKGYDSRGRPGELSEAQIRWGNRTHLMGFPVACFFDPDAAVRWLQSLGAPVRLRGGL